MIDIESLPSHQISSIQAWQQITGRKFDSQKDGWPVFTYTITDGEYIKVGRADHIRKRINALRTGNPRELKLLGFVVGDIEKRVLDRLKRAGLHVSGEWFDDYTETRDILRSVGLLVDSNPSGQAVEEHW